MTKILKLNEPNGELDHGFSEKIMKTDIYRTAVSEYPTLFLSETCEIIDVSERFRSCCADNANRTFLSEILSDADYVKLQAFCREKESDTLLCRIYYKKYRYAVAHAVACGNKRFTIFLLSSTVKDTITLKAYLAGMMPHGTFESYCREKTENDEDFFGAFRMLVSPYSYIFLRESTTFLRDFVDKLARKSDQFPYRMTINGIEELPDCDVKVHSGGIALSIVSLIGVLGPMSKNAKLTFATEVADDIFKVEISTELPYDIKLRGETASITGLASHVPGSFMYLFLAELAALETGIRIMVKCTGSQIKFTVGVPVVSDGSLRFNYRDVEELSEHIVLLVCSVFTSQMLSICNQKESQ